MIEADVLAQAANIPLDRAAFWAGHLQRAFIRHSITTNERMAAFIAQAGHESARFSRWVESLKYSNPARIASTFWRAFKPSATQESDIQDMLDAGQLTEAQAEEERMRIATHNATQYVNSPERLANRAYALILGNGDIDSGDGWLYRGRGLLQITGRDNYMRAEAGTSLPLVAFPDRLLEPDAAAEVSAWLWQSSGWNALADAGRIDAITLRLNGKAMLGRAERARAFEHALSVFAKRGEASS